MDTLVELLLLDINWCNLD